MPWQISLSLFKLLMTYLCIFWWGGDFNNNVKNVARFSHWFHFLNQYTTSQIHLAENAYHHHIGHGVFDSIINGAILTNPLLMLFSPSIINCAPSNIPSYCYVPKNPVLTQKAILTTYVQSLLIV